MSYYYVAYDGNQYGPTESIDELKALLLNGTIEPTALVYGEDVTSWTAVQDLPALLEQIKPPPPPPKPTRAPPRMPSTEVKALSQPWRTHCQMTPGRDLGNGWFERKTLDQATYYFHAHTGKLQWDMPEEPDGSSGTDSGDYAFLPDADEGWLPVRSLGGRFQSINGGEVRASAAAFARALPLRLSWLADKWLVQANDLVLLPEIHDGLVLESLRRRFHKQHIYTAVGPILVAINPFQLFPTLYGTEAIHKYRTRGNRDLPPHPYLTAAAAYQQLLEGCVPQSILVSGESGAGKTETTKHCLSFLAAVAGPSSAASSGSGVEAKLLSVNPILEAFGNAKTARNDNSSRFGRLTELWFSNDFRISGATITNYLLEKARASGPTPGERNFHSFYQVASSSQASRFGVDTNFSLLGSCATAHGIDDISDAAEVEEAFSVLGLSHDEFEMVLGAVAAVLHLGELSFKRDDSSDHDGAVLNHCSEVHAQWAARLLGVNDDDGVSCVQLKRALLSKTSQFGSEAVAVPLRHDQACESRDALARLVYGRLFDWLVTKVNIHLAALDVMAARSIGILDIFGFEVFKENGFNQLCINFANEKLQSRFNLDTFKTETDVLVTEGVSVPGVLSCPDNSLLVSLLECRRSGIFAVIDEVVRTPGRENKYKDSLLSGAFEARFGSSHFIKTIANSKSFTVMHYAGSVSYSVSGFCERSMDSPSPDLVQILARSMVPVVSVLALGTTVGSTTVGRSVTLGLRFVDSMKELMSKLNGTCAHYIRCIKPNSLKAREVFSGGLVFEQLRYSGILEALVIRRSGLPFRFKFSDFVRRYRCVFLIERSLSCREMSTRPPLSSMIPSNQCREVLSATGQSFAALRLGKTMVMFRSEEFRTLELCRALAVETLSVSVQALARGHLARVFLEKARLITPELSAAAASRDLVALTIALDKSTAILGTLSVAIPLREFKRAKDLQAALIASPGYLNRLRREAWADLSIEENFELLFNTLQEPQFRVCVAEKCLDELVEVEKIAEQQLEAWTEWRLVPRFEDALKTLERDQLLQLKLEANRLGYKNTAHIAAIDDALALQPVDLIKRQLQRAIQSGDVFRSCVKESELKDLALDRFPPEALSLSACALLKTPATYAEGVWLGSRAEEARVTMRRWQHGPLVQSLTPLSAVNATKAKAAFRDIQTCMGDHKIRKGDSEVDVLQRLIADASAVPELRPEVYAQILKQLVKNPSEESTVKGWKLVLLLLQRISPGSAFDPFIHMAIRQSALPAALKKRLQLSLHAAAYFKEADETSLSASEAQTLHLTIGEEFDALFST